MSRMMSFDAVEFHGCGNEVELSVKLTPDEAPIATA
jgi:hypothetical protein